ncbi:MAG: hypothetical protein ACRCTY_09740 [Candidatus Adiutrix sp.]
MSAKKIILIWACFFTLFLAEKAMAAEYSVIQAFMKLPDSQCAGLNQNARERLVETILPKPGAAGRPSVPNVQEPWLRLLAENTLVLRRPGVGAITYKFFPGRGPGRGVLAVCRGGETVPAIDPACPFGLCFFRAERGELTFVDHQEYMPSVSILDFITPDTLNDPKAVSDLASIGPNYGHCLSCNATTTEADTINIVTATSINTGVCGRILPTFGFLPLTWNGLEFVKPYNRAAPRP